MRLASDIRSVLLRAARKWVVRLRIACLLFVRAKKSSLEWNPDWAGLVFVIANTVFVLKDPASRRTPMANHESAAAPDPENQAPGIGHHTVTIIVNGTPEEWSGRNITYAQVVTLFDPEYPQHPEVTYSVTYDHGPGQNHEGILSPGETVRIKEGMVFNVKRTGES
jgi:hypothetical protein